MPVGRHSGAGIREQSSTVIGWNSRFAGRATFAVALLFCAALNEKSD
jgi:hypothetical protein